MKEFRADMHCHTTCSDGSKTPEEVIQLALQIGLSGLSITDHDTIEAYTQAIPLAEKLGLEIVSGVEFSSMLSDVPVHILGYSFDLKHPVLNDLCQKHILRRTERNRMMLAALQKNGFKISEEELFELATKHPGKHSIGRPHIALLMMQKGYVKSIQDAFKKYLGEGCSCYIRGESISVEETIDAIHQAKGLAVIAHPHLINHIPTLRKLMQMNFDGLEGYYSKFPPEVQNQWVEAAQKKEWLITGGSDFHGDVKPNTPLGCSWIQKETFSILKDRLKDNCAHGNI